MDAHTTRTTPVADAGAADMGYHYPILPPGTYAEVVLNDG